VPHETHTIGAIIRQAFRINGLGQPKISVTCVSMQMQTALVETGRFITVVPASYLRFRSNTTSLRVLPVDLQVSVPPIGFVTLKNRAISPVTELFIKTLRTVAKERM
jgi:DNA-binding transcriptional LysR family regulator